MSNFEANQYVMEFDGGIPSSCVTFTHVDGAYYSQQLVVAYERAIRLCPDTPRIWAQFVTRLQWPLNSHCSIFCGCVDHFMQLFSGEFWVHWERYYILGYGLRHR